jgi:phage shock protein A
MANLDDAYAALRNADASGDAEGARKLAAYIQGQTLAPVDAKASEDGLSMRALKGVDQYYRNMIGGQIRGAASIGSTLMWPIDKATDMIKGDRDQNITGLITGQQPISRNQERRASLDSSIKNVFDSDPDSLIYGANKLTTEVLGTSGIGGVLANGAKTLGAAPSVVNSLSTAGMKAGDTPGVVNMLTRMFGGAATGAASAGLVNPSDAEIGAAVGGVLPPALAGIGKAAGYVGRNINALIQPFTENGQSAIAQNIVRKFAEGGPTSVNLRELVPGSAPTLAEATGNAGLARLQSTVRDVNPNAFTERAASNSAARSAALDDLAGDAGKLDFYRGERSESAKKLYGDAMAQGVNPEAMTPFVKGQVTQLMQRPSIQAAMKDARKLAAEDGKKLTDSTSLEGLHYTKLGLDQQINDAVRAGNGTLARSLMGTKDMLEGTIDKLSPAYAEARATFAEMSKPVNQMEALQGLKLTDATGNITLSKIQNAIDGLEKKMTGPGTNTAKSLTGEQMNSLKAIRDDLLRQNAANAGKSAGSNTFQNIATENIVSNLLPGQIGNYVNGKAGGVMGQIGKLAYSGPNQAIRNKLVDTMLNPEMAQPALNPLLTQPGVMNRLAGQTAPLLYRSAPVLSSSR